VEKATCEKPKMIIPGTNKVYEVLQFHIHTGCENQFNMTGCDADLHMVHIAKEDVALPKAATFAALPDLAVLGLMMYGGDVAPEETGMLGPLIDSWMSNTCTGDAKCLSSVAQDMKATKFSPYDLVPGGTAVFNFQGSLTTPPCWEVVNWNLVEKPVLMSFKQILQISNLIQKYNGYKSKAVEGGDATCVEDATVANVAGLTARDLQPMNGRSVVKNCAPMSIMGAFPLAEATPVEPVEGETVVGDTAEEAETVPKTQSVESSANMASWKAASLVAAAVSAFALF
jgi:carbonic anhydrase